LLIVPNPESALNEEAGKLLLEDYASYASHAKLWTSIHANPKINVANTGISVGDSQDSAASAAEPASVEGSPKKRELQASKTDKKRSIRRL
jgi:ubiquitin-conjugating enzyme E2 S